MDGVGPILQQQNVGHCDVAPQQLYDVAQHNRTLLKPTVTEIRPWRNLNVWQAECLVGCEVGMVLLGHGAVTVNWWLHLELLLQSALVLY